MANPDFIGLSFIPARPPTNVPPMLDTGITPLEWVSILADRGINISERTLREKANKLGARIKLGRHMLITMGHMETILKDDSKCRSNRTSGKVSGGLKVVSNTTDNQSPSSRDPALERAQKLVLGNGVQKKRTANVGSISSVLNQKSKSKAR